MSLRDVIFEIKSELGTLLDQVNFTQMIATVLNQPESES